MDLSATSTTKSNDDVEFVGRKAVHILPPTGLGNDFEVAAIRPPRALLHDLLPIFPDLRQKIKDSESNSSEQLPKVAGQRRTDLSHRLIVVPTVQRANADLAGIGPDVEAEKNRLLDSFNDWARVVSFRLQQIAKHRHEASIPQSSDGDGDDDVWVDFIDPMTALPTLGSRGPSGYSEVEGFQLLLKYPVQNVGCCNIILHPRWRSRIYPATLFTTAPAADLLLALRGSVLAPGARVRLMNPVASNPALAVLTSGRIDAIASGCDDDDASTTEETQSRRSTTISAVVQDLDRVAVSLDWLMADGTRAKAYTRLRMLQGTRTSLESPQ